MVSGISAALSGYSAALTQLDVAASNIANQVSNQSTDQAGNTINTPYVPRQVVQSSVAGGGVATNTAAVRPASVGQYDPTNPAANTQGFVQTPNVDPVRQILNIDVAGYDAKANLKTFKVQDEILRQELNIVS